MTTKTLTLIAGETYDLKTLTLAGWTKGDGSSREGYNLGDYFDRDGEYQGADEHGIEPIVEAQTYVVTWSNGDADEEFDTVAEAVASLEARYPDLEYGHDGDLSDGGDRTLVWANEEDSANDAGAKAIASIRKA